MKTGAIIGILAVVLVVITAIFVIISNNAGQDNVQENQEGTSRSGAGLLENTPGNVVCTQDAKLCPDGTEVGRVPPNCEFATCPTSEIQNEEFIVDITSSGFSPKTIEINQGDTVTWTNQGSSSSWPASAVHPTHNVYPESGGCIGSKFDACRGLSQGESYSFTFNQKGTWGYHDHLNPSLKGTVIVK